MSSIFGIVDRQEVSTFDGLNAMKRVMNYWQADAEGLFKDKKVGLGHLMLHNTSDSPGAVQPLTDQEKRFTIVADARIDNRNELLHSLQIDRVRGNTLPDSEIILLSYKKWGKSSAEKIRGDFAYAIWDSHECELICVRDRLGIKPLFYFSGERFLFSSEIKGLLALPETPRTINEQWVADYTAMLILDKTSTMYNSIYKVPPAHMLILKNGSVSLKEYWQLAIPKKLKLQDKNEYSAAIAEEMQRAVACRMRSSFPISTELSGGLDSSMVTAVAQSIAAKNNQSLHAFSHALTEEQKEKFTLVDESKKIDQIVNFLQLNNHHYVTDTSSFYDSVEQLLQTVDEPPRVNFNLFASDLHIKASQSNSRVLLSGLGGDEMLTNPVHGYNLELLQNLKWKRLWLKLILDASGNGIKALKGLWSLVRLSLSNHIKGQNSGMSELLSLLPLTDGYLKEMQIEKRLRQRRLYQKAKSVQDLMLIRVNSPGLQDRLENGTLALKALKMEYRYPMLDTRLMEFFLSIPEELRLFQGKRGYLFKDGVHELLKLPIFDKKDNAAMTIPNAFHRVNEDVFRLKNFLDDTTCPKLNGYDFDKIRNSLSKIPHYNTDQTSPSPMPTIRAIILLKKLEMIL